MNRLLTTSLVAAALTLVGCGTAQPTVSPLAKQTQKVGARYLVFFINDVATTPAPQGASHRFRTATIQGAGGFPRTDALTLTAMFSEANGKVSVALKRNGKPFTQDERGFYLTQFSNFLVMGGPTPAQREVLDEVLKWTRGAQT